MGVQEYTDLGLFVGAGLTQFRMTLVMHGRLENQTPGQLTMCVRVYDGVLYSARMALMEDALGTSNDASIDPLDESVRDASDEAAQVSDEVVSDAADEVVPDVSSDPSN
ncbi:hypothetical protein SBRCBS47491_008584 [Sporothrix bragantina]|uniref:Uncharacterized protein n=1 Tax=Sporothrix bragantina TaxID=671064 RepID=A0ABP0CMN2_9PEZI